MNLSIDELALRLISTQKYLRERNALIAVDVLNGATLADTGVVFGLSRNRIREIVRSFCRDMNRRYFRGAYAGSNNNAKGATSIYLYKDKRLTGLSLYEMRKSKHLFLDSDYVQRFETQSECDGAFTERTKNSLSREGIYSFDDLILWSEADLLRTPDLGKKSLTEIKDVLAARGLHLKGVSYEDISSS
jgi:hypothetical protein